MIKLIEYIGTNPKRNSGLKITRPDDPLTQKTLREEGWIPSTDPSIPNDMPDTLRRVKREDVADEVAELKKKIAELEKGKKDPVEQPETINSETPKRKGDRPKKTTV